MANEHVGLRVGSRLQVLVGAYPRPDDVLKAAAVGRREQSAVARLWVSEGIPFAFRKCPGLYEEGRRWLAEGLGVDPKEISLAGSGRLGYSLAPRRWGEKYDPESSDVDFFAVSEGLFERLREDFERWSREFDEGAIQPRASEQGYWLANQQETPRNLRRGFVDSKRVPNRPNYDHFRRLNNRLAGLRVRLVGFDGGPTPPGKLTLRCYRDWAAFERQLAVNLGAAVDWFARMTSAQGSST